MNKIIIILIALLGFATVNAQIDKAINNFSKKVEKKVKLTASKTEQFILKFEKEFQIAFNELKNSIEKIENELDPNVKKAVYKTKEGISSTEKHLLSVSRKLEKDLKSGKISKEEYNQKIEKIEKQSEKLQKSIKGFIVSLKDN